MENYRKHIGDLQRTGPREARVGRKSGRPPVPAYYWHATRRPVQYTPHQKRRSDARCDIIISRGLRRTSPCRARHTKIGDRTLGVILQSPEACNVQARAAHAKPKRRSNARSISFHITGTTSISTRRPGPSAECPHLAWLLQNASNTGRDSDKRAPRTGGHAGIRHSTAT